MALAQYGYDEEQTTIGFETYLGKDADRFPFDKLPDGEQYLEVVGFQVFEAKNGTDYLEILLHDGHGRIARMFGKIQRNTIWKLQKAVRGIWGRRLPLEQIQGPGGTTPTQTRERALGVWCKVEVKTSEQYDNQDILILGEQNYDRGPEGTRPMFDARTHEATGNWATDGKAFLAARAGDSADESGADEDW